MLQNRLDPNGAIIKTGSRGAWMGNRGVIHNALKELLKQFSLKTWITCRLEFKGRTREIMAPKRYTELFSLDEATAFAAGHRPCSECRRDDYKRFKEKWLEANAAYGFTEKTKIAEIDNVLHSERIDRNGKKNSYRAPLNELPDGTFMLLHNAPFLKWKNWLYRWSPAGYIEKQSGDTLSTVEVLTPASIVNMFRAGYIPQVDLDAPVNVDPDPI
jgi:hypothetical protein